MTRRAKRPEPVGLSVDELIDLLSRDELMALVRKINAMPTDSIENCIKAAHQMKIVILRATTKALVDTLSTSA